MFSFSKFFQFLSPTSPPKLLFENPLSMVDALNCEYLGGLALDSFSNALVFHKLWEHSCAYDESKKSVQTLVLIGTRGGGVQFKDALVAWRTDYPLNARLASSRPWKQFHGNIRIGLFNSENPQYQYSYNILGHELHV